LLAKRFLELVLAKASLSLGLLQFLFKTLDLFGLVYDELNGGGLLRFHVFDD
jgi:hypothetical protein